MSKCITRQEAAAQNLTMYFTGKECLRGHITFRKTCNGVCTECAKLLTRRWRKEGKRCEMNPAKVLPSADYLSQCFNIKDNTLYWATRPPEHFGTTKGYNLHLSKLAGKLAGHVNKVHKYTEVRLDGVLHKGHRIVYKMLTGIEPTFIVDHKDGNVTNNEIGNLRESNSQENSRNSQKRTRIGSSQYKGVYQTSQGLWYSVVTVDDVATKELAESELQAALKYDTRVRELFGEFAKTNFELGVAYEDA